MDNPIFIPIRFAANGLKNVIQKVLQVGQDPEDMTWNLGTPQITMIPKEDGGLPPKGQDFNGILYTLSDHAVQRQNGGQIVFSDDVVAEYGGYALGSIVQSNDTLRHFRSLINNNTFNPNTQPISGRWEIYTGAGSIPTASSTTAGVMRVINNLASTEVGSALSAAMGKKIIDDLAALLATNGWQKLPSGLIIQWGETIVLPNNSPTNTVLPMAFPNGFLQAVTSMSGAAASTSVAGVSPLSKTSITLYQGSATTQTVRWVVLGY